MRHGGAVVVSRDAAAALLSVLRVRPLEEALIHARGRENDWTLASMAEPNPPPHPAYRGFDTPSAEVGDSEDDDSLASLLLSGRWDCDGCPPPFFHLPPPPRPPDLYEEEDCSAEANISPYESCDNPVIVGDLHLKNEALNVVAVAAAAASLVAVVLLVACLVYRRRATSGAASSRAAAKRSPPTGDSGPSGSACADREFAVATMAKPSGGGAGIFGGHARDDPEFEMAEHSSPLPLGSAASRHVYANPNYPTMEIGGLPFYLMPAAAPTAAAPAPPSSTTTGSSSAPPSSSSPSERDGHLIGRGGPPPPLPHLYEPGSSGGGTMRSGGPIYEDIDRMCSYRGAPPEMSPARRPQLARRTGRGRRTPSEKEADEVADDRTYYNVSPRGDSGSSDVTSSPRPNHGNTSSSEISFESVGSPRHAATTSAAAEDTPRTNIIVNPGLSPAHRPFGRTLGAATSQRGSGRAGPTAAPSSPSVYYYSDTLRPNRRREGADRGGGGIMSSEDPPALPSARLAALAASPGAASGRRSATGRGPKKRTALL